MSSTLNASDIATGVAALAEQILTKAGGEKVALIGIRSRGDEVAERVREILSQHGSVPDFGVLDISLYRDDYGHLRENPKLQGSDIPFDVDGRRLILVDDVLFTGRTIRAALDALSDYGRPGKVELAVLIDRGHREMPIEPGYVGIVLETERHDHVYVSLQKTDGEDRIEIRTAE